MTTRILYLHGFASGPSSTKARYFRDRLRELGVELEIPDLTGGNLESLTITRQLAVVERVAAGEPVALIGSSMGAYLAALYAARHPETPRIVLLAPAFGFPRRWLEELGADRVEDWRRTGYLSVFDYAEGREARVGYGLIEDSSRYEDYPATTQPVLIYHGTADETVPYRLSEEFAALRCQVRLELLDSGHQLLDRLEVIWEGARGFLGFGEHGTGAGSR